MIKPPEEVIAMQTITADMLKKSSVKVKQTKKMADRKQFRAYRNFLGYNKLFLRNFLSPRSP